MNARSIRMTRVGSLVAAAVVASAAVVGVASPAFAADPGTLTVVGPTTGAVGTSPFQTSATSSAQCPAGYGTNVSLQVGVAGATGSNLFNLAPIGTAGGYDANGPVTVAPNRSLARAITGSDAGTVPNGQYQVTLLCVSDQNGDFNGYFRSQSFTVNNGTYTWPIAATATTTVLTANPASGAGYAGANITLSAAVTAANTNNGTPAGTVTFKDGANTLGTDATAPYELVTNALSASSHNLSAVFAPSSNHTGSTGTLNGYIVNAPIGTPTVNENIEAPVQQGGFTLTADAATVVLTGGQVGGTASGSLNDATVTDLRGTGAAWNVTGQVGDFHAGTNTIPAYRLGWTPSAVVVDSEAGAVTAGPAIVSDGLPGTDAAKGLDDVRTLCGAAAGTNAGVFKCDAGLALKIPQSAAPGNYSAVLTLTLI